MKQNHNRVDLLGVLVDCISVDESIELMTNHIEQRTRKSMLVIKPYAKTLLGTIKNKRLKDHLNYADLSLADGISLQWAASYLYGKPNNYPSLIKLIKSLMVWIFRDSWLEQIIPTRGAGVDSTSKLLHLAGKKKWRVGIISGHLDRVDSIKTNVATKFNIEKLWVWTGYFEAGSATEMEILEQIKGNKLDLLFVGRGFPLQEEFIYLHRNDNLAKVLIGEGGTFDYDQMGGSVRRAPLFWRRIGFEWLWRAFAQLNKLNNLLLVPRFIFKIQKQAKKQK